MALTVGVQTVLESREVVIVVTGQRKALALSKAIEEGVNHLVRVILPFCNAKSSVEKSASEGEGLDRFYGCTNKKVIA